MNVVFITGNDKKVEFLNKHLGLEIEHQKLELDEIQSLDLHEVTEHKVRQAYDIVNRPVLVEDVAFSLKAMGKLPGTLVKWFLAELDVKGLCKLADMYGDRRATAEVCYAYFDGKTVKFFDGKLEGIVAEKPRTDDGFGWNRIFIPKGQTKANSEMLEEEIAKHSVRTREVYPQLKKFLNSIDNQ